MATKTKSDEGKVTSGPLKDQHDFAQERTRAGDMASAREGLPGTLAGDGKIDNMTRASDADALEGHFCYIDLNHKDVSEELRESGRDYGVYEQPGVLDNETGRPLTAVVQLRDDTHEKVTVPYEALRPAPAGRR